MALSFQSRSLVVCSVLVTGLSLLSARLIQIQLLDRQRYAESSWSTYHRVEPLPAMRGTIVDCNEEVLARSLPVSSVMVDLNHLNDEKIAAFGLAYAQAMASPKWASLDNRKRRALVYQLRGEILESETPATIIEKHKAYAISVLCGPLRLAREDIRARIEGGKGQYFAIAKDLPGDVAELLRGAIEDSGVRGLEIENSLKRWYSASMTAAHVVGITGEKVEKDPDGKEGDGKESRQVVGMSGIESAMESYLAGRDGWREHRSDSRGLPLPGDSGSLMPPKAGLNVQLTLDMGLQVIAEEELDSALAEFEAKKGTVVLMDPNTGGILAMVSRPNYDLNVRDKRMVTNGSNFALQAVYEPGSTFKIIASAAALNEGLVTPQTSIFCHNGLYVEGPVKVPDHSPYGNLTVEGVLQKSSNIGAYKLARQLGNERFYSYVHRFGFGTRTGILLSGEVNGMVRNSGNPVDFSRASYGYALNVTPLQVACAYSAIANGGELLKPHIVKALVANDGSVVESYDREVVGRAIKTETARKMRTALEKVVDKLGTAPLAAVPGFRVAGKTGTAKMHDPKGRGYLEGQYTVSFAGMMPSENPAFVAVVVIEDPRTTKVTRYGGTIAAPAFGKMAARIATRMNLQPTEPVEAPRLTTTAR